jgi:hypothetical protein
MASRRVSPRPRTAAETLEHPARPPRRCLAAPVGASGRVSLAAALLCLLAAACARTTLQSSVADTHGGTKPTEEMDFWDGIVATPAVSNRDAIHSLMLHFGQRAQGEKSDWDTERAAAAKRGWVEADADLSPNETARVGMIARVVCMEAGIAGGATMRVVGPTGRYAVKELNSMGWLPDMVPSQSISGPQLIAVLSRAEDRLAGRKDTGPKEDM